MSSLWNKDLNQRDFLNEKYHVDALSMRNRVALLITNINFNELKRRDGAERDEQAMVQLLRLLGYEVVKYNDLSGKEIDNALVRFSEHPKLAHTDSVFVVIMSHGGLGFIAGTGKQQDRFEIDNIYKRLNNENCPKLLNKPKIIIIQACRGGEVGEVDVKDDVFDGVMQADAMVHKEMDFASLLSSTPHCSSYRNSIYGSFFIHYFVKIFMSYYRQDHIDDLFLRVIHCFKDIPKQLPTIERQTLMKHFYLVPEKDLVVPQRMVSDGVCSGMAQLSVSEKGTKKKEDRFQ